LINSTDVEAIRQPILEDANLPESPWPELNSSSPSDGEAGVAITRETILRFSSPLNDSADLDASISAQFAGKEIRIRTNISANRKTLTVFYPDLLPSGSRVRMTLNAESLKGDDTYSPDVNGDGTPGGTATIDFDTLGLTVLAGTSVSGRVFASEPRSTAEGIEFVNVPLTGVRITVDGQEDALSATTDGMGNFSLSPSLML
jgi:hypothetical protein